MKAGDEKRSWIIIPHALTRRAYPPPRGGFSGGYKQDVRDFIERVGYKDGTKSPEGTAQAEPMAGDTRVQHCPRSEPAGR